MEFLRVATTSSEDEEGSVGTVDRDDGRGKMAGWVGGWLAGLLAGWGGWV